MDAEADSMLSLPSERLMELLGTQNVTYKLLLEHLQAADDNYHAMRDQHEAARGGSHVARQLSDETSQESRAGPRRRQSRFEN
jgi:hypothetical protein